LELEFCLLQLCWQSLYVLFLQSISSENSSFLALGDPVAISKKTQDVLIELHSGDEGVYNATKDA
jgi:hypothetical protein